MTQTCGVVSCYMLHAVELDEFGSYKVLVVMFEFFFLHESH